ncbi:MAG: helix-turn-helix transcriptional regulator [Caldilinea sp.]|nr:helix-turn-helix transcriptional regulator [Caldilineaceae bacterium]MCB9120496.1 helix-turn-helix transcriptional regulator [Caldilineaceae bacterium]MCW5842445.1 helix-turn-helix transcriptional regulator [Caldilinea sp.]
MSKQRSSSQATPDDAGSAAQEGHVGQRLRQLRTERGMSIRALAEASGLSVNTLSLIENGKISPSVSTLHRAAAALGVIITAFFEVPAPRQNVVCLRSVHRNEVPFDHGTLEDLAVGFAGRRLRPSLVTLEPHNGSGAEPIVHTGFEFVYCLEGCITYRVDGQVYRLAPGDSLIFESHLPHCWQNEEDTPARMLLVLTPTDDLDRPVHRHFTAGDTAEQQNSP